MPYFTVFTSSYNFTKTHRKIVQNNHREYLDEAIQSVLKQTFVDFEYLLVNDGSSDDTIDVMNGYAKKDDRIRVFDLPKQPNVATVLNFGIKRMNPDSKYWIWLPSDDIFYKTALRVRFEYSKKFPECVLYSDFNKISTEGTLSLKVQKDWYQKEKDIVYGRNFPGVYSTGITIPVKAFVKAGMYPEHIKMGEDAHWIHNSVMSGVKYKKIPGVLHAKRQHPPNPQRKQKLKAWRNRTLKFSKKLGREARCRILIVCGARPNFVKIAALIPCLEQEKIRYKILHTGQHYDHSLSDSFFEDLKIPSPDFNLGVGSLSHAQQTAEIMSRFEPIIEKTRPKWLVVVGDVNSTLACALVASKTRTKIAHIEAGLRSFDNSMPEEINRRLTDAVSDVLFVSEQSGISNLLREGISPDCIHFVGNTLIDTLLRYKDIAPAPNLPSKYVVCTFHRPSNTGKSAHQIIGAINRIAMSMPVIFPVHPRSKAVFTRDRLSTNVRLLDPLSYLDFLGMLVHSYVVITDSGGIQEETTALRVPCITVRDNTERPITLTHGSNILVPANTQRICEAFQKVRDRNYNYELPPLWDGKAASRIVNVLKKRRGAQIKTVSSTRTRLDSGHM